MPIYEVTEVGSERGGGCLGILLALGLCVLAVSALEDACNPAPHRPTGRTMPSEGSPSSAPDPHSAPASEAQQPKRKRPEPQQPERTLHERYVNGWVLQRLRKESRPVALIAMYGTTAFEDRITQALRERGVNAQTGVLKRVAFKTDPLFQRIKGGDGETLRALGLSQLDGALVLCRLSLGDLTETPDGYVTKAYFDVVLVPMEGGRPVRRAFEAEGGGFTSADAEEQARERVRSDFLTSSLADRLTTPSTNR